MSTIYKPEARIRLPQPHQHQEIFLDWQHLFPEAQCLVAPCGTKLGKSFGCSIWFAQEALINPGMYMLWSAPTLAKARIGYRYVKKMLPDIPLIDCRDGKQEIHFANGSFMTFLHGRDAETAVEGEAVDRFVIDEAGKQKAQLWYSLFTTLTQTLGYGIMTGTPRGNAHFYYEVFRKAVEGDPFFCWAQLQTILSPYVTEAAVEQAKRLLPPDLFRQYYLAEFVSSSEVYGDLEGVWQKDWEIARKNFWVIPDKDARSISVCIGVDLAKHGDWTVFAAINAKGQTVGYARFKNKPYQEQSKYLALFTQYFKGGSNTLRYDRTGVGDAVGEMINEEMETVDGDWTVEAVVFTNRGKQEMVSRNTLAIQSGWWKCPMIERVQHEFSSLEVSVTQSGLHSYAAPSGEHDDVHWAFSLGISGAYSSIMAEAAIDMIEQALSGKMLTSETDVSVTNPGQVENLIAGDAEDEDFDMDLEDID